MKQLSIPAVFMRGGTSKGLFFKSEDLPASKTDRDAIFISALGSPDPYGRQLNGMGGGVSSVSKAVIIKLSDRDDADLDYTFVQIAIKKSIADYSSNCGNLSSAVGPFAIEEGMIKAKNERTLVRVFNTNLQCIFHARIPTIKKTFSPDGEFSIPGVSGTGSKIELNYLNPGGSSTGKLLPTGNVIETLEIPKIGDFEVSIIDASAATVFINSNTLNLTCKESIEELERNKNLMTTLEKIRQAASVRMGLTSIQETAPLGVPKICIVSSSSKFKTLSGCSIYKEDSNLFARYVSIGQIHRALPLTGAMCIAIASQIKGTICYNLSTATSEKIKISNPSGVLPVTANVTGKGNEWLAHDVTVYRTARTLMSGKVFITEKLDLNH